MTTATNEANKGRRRLLAACAATALSVATALGAVLCLPAHTAPKQKAAPKPEADKKAPAVKQFPVYVLDVPNTQQPFSVYLNGWLLDSSAGGPQGYFSSSKIGIYVADGTNTLTIHVLLSAPSSPVPDNFQVRIRSTEGEVFYYDWDPTDPKRRPPFTTEQHFTAHLPHPWAWQTAPKITLDAPTKAAINAHVKEMFDALSTKNVDKTTALFRLSARLGYAARNLPPEQADADDRAEWVSTFAEPNWHMKPINYATLTYDLIGDGRVVNVSGSHDTYALMNLKGDAAYDLFFSFINGQWTQVR